MATHTPVTTTRGQWTTCGSGNLLRFDTLADAAAWCSTDVKYHTEGDNDPASRRTDMSEWFATDSMQHAVDIVAGRAEWSVADDVERMLADVAPVLASVDGRRVQRRYMVAGGSVNVARAMAGDPRCMRQVHMVPAPRVGRVVTVLVNGTANSNVSAETMLHNGTVVYAFIEALRRAGIGVNVVVACTTARAATRGHVETTTTALFQVAAAGHAPDMRDVMFGVAHPAMLRRFMFGAMERLAPAKRKAAGVDGGGYGRAVRVPNDVLADIGADIHIDGEMSREISNPGEYIRRKLQDCGVILTDK